MPNIVRNLIALLVGVTVGGGVNMGIVVLGSTLIPPPAGVDVSNAASISAAMHLYEPRHFVVPFLAHALGTLAGALVGCLLARTHKAAVAMAIGAVFLAGGIAASMMIAAPGWFVVLDLLVAYIPMAWLGLMLGRRIGAGLAGARPGPGA